MVEQTTGNEGRNGVVRLFGYQETLSLDGRGRFRLPDDLAAALQREMGRVAPRSAPTPIDRPAFYFVPGTQRRIFLYPAANIQLAIDRFERPPAGMDPDVVRKARDYFYYRMRFVEADKQNRFTLPEGLREHAEIDDSVGHVSLVAHNHWLSLSPAELDQQRATDNLEAFEQAAEDLLNPVLPIASPVPAGPSAPEGDEQT